MTDDRPSRRLALAALLAAPAALATAARAGGDDTAAEEGAPCPGLVGHVARFLGPNDPMTMDYNPDRVNIFHDGNNVITRITWG